MIHETFVKDEEKEVKCECGGIAVRQLSAPKCFQNTTGKSPSLKQCNALTGVFY